MSANTNINQIPRRPRRRRRALVGAVLVGAAAIGAGGFLLQQRDDRAAATSEAPATTEAPSTATSTRGDLQTNDEFSATVSFGEDWTLPIAATGMITQFPAQGTQVNFGDELLRIDNRPIFLVEGDVPLYRTLEYKQPKKERIAGDDVRQLQTFLRTTGVDGADKLEVDGDYGRATEKVVKAWQKSIGVAETGTVDRTLVIFAPTPVRVASDGRVGTTFADYKVTGSTAVVEASVRSRERTALPVGSKVTLQAGDTELTATVTAQTRATGDDGTPVYKVTVEPEGALPGDASSATVLATKVLAEDAVLVPVSALVALSEGGYAVEVENGGSFTLTGVEIGEVFDGQAEITSGIDEGVTVKVAAS